MDQVLGATPIEWLRGIGFCLTYLAGMRTVACAAAICRELFAAAPPDFSNR
jgi:hypothetical protein